MASRSSNKARALLFHLRQSQCLEVFINERLLMASKGFLDEDDFERKVLPRVLLVPHLTWANGWMAGTAWCFCAGLYLWALPARHVSEDKCRSS